ncbi:MAG: HAMP domain-containing histidine kinase [Pseudarcicella sp.]|nr:HAMP domain-containing histidine kinase [Pseudarcicella sp.]
MILPVDIYNSNNWLKLAFLIFCILIGGLSLFYTSNIVDKLQSREKEQIELYAESLKYVITSELDKDVTFLFEKIKKSNENITIPIVYKNTSGFLEGYHVDMPENLSPEAQQVFLKLKLQDILKDDYQPIEVDTGLKDKIYIYYGNSLLLNQLKYFPLLQLALVLIFGFVAYLAFSSARKAEQNRVWVGLAKETAHQLGTPLTSLIAWIEYFKNDPKYDIEIVKELEKDVQRLDVITTRFSNIGSVPILKEEDIFIVVSEFLSYLQKRISTKIKVEIINTLAQTNQVKINKYLFEWVIENICKNAVDAMTGVGKLTVNIQEDLKLEQIYIDISDTGKGISKQNVSKVFDAGFSTKKRGWGLGLTLAKRIIENYHGGKIFVKSNELNKGVTFRISLPIK